MNTNMHPYQIVYSPAARESIEQYPEIYDREKIERAIQNISRDDLPPPQEMKDFELYETENQRRKLRAYIINHDNHTLEVDFFATLVIDAP